jgi:peptidyl-prolyl cis-trans isomerase SurA
MTHARRQLSFPTAVAILAGCALGLLTPGHAAHVADKIVAVVNNEVIMLSELKTESAAETKRIRERYKGEEQARRLQQAEYMALNRMIERKLQLQWAKAKGVDVTEDEVKTAMRELQKQGEHVDETSTDDRKNVKEQLVLLRVVDREVRGNVMVAERDMQRFYEEHKPRFSLPEEYRISQILIVPRAGEERAEARSRAAAVYAQLKKGADFGDLAIRQSDGAEAARGGSLGYIRQGEVLPQIERALSTLQPGDITEPVESAEGFHIIRLDEKKPPQFRPFPEIKTEVQNLLYQQKTEDLYQTWIASLKKKAFIEVKF